MKPGIKVRGYGLFSFATVTALKETEIKRHLDLFQLTEITSKIRSDIESYQSYRNEHCFWHEKKVLIQGLLTLSTNVHTEMVQLESQRTQGLENHTLLDVNELYPQENFFYSQYIKVIKTIKDGLPKLHQAGKYTIYGVGNAPGNHFQRGNTYKLQQPLEDLKTLLNDHSRYALLNPASDAIISHNRNIREKSTVNNSAGAGGGGGDKSPADAGISNANEIEIEMKTFG